MHTIHFYKYQGAGNDFIIIDNRTGDFTLTDPALLARLCDRRFGIGADGLMLLGNSEQADFQMTYFNADGQPGSMCGNGGRCIVAFAKKLGIIDSSTDFLAVDGPHHAHISVNGNWVSLQMIDVDHIYSDGDASVLNTGSPHYVRQVDGLAELDVFSAGKAVRYNDTYRKAGINVNFVEEEGEGYFVRTYERGVEDETLACGTGVTAVALAMAARKGLEGDVNTSIRVPGGHLNVRFTSNGRGAFTNVLLEGPAEYVFEGRISLAI